MMRLLCLGSLMLLCGCANTASPDGAARNVIAMEFTSSSTAAQIGDAIDDYLTKCTIARNPTFNGYQGMGRETKPDGIRVLTIGAGESRLSVKSGAHQGGQGYIVQSVVTGDPGRKAAFEADIESAIAGQSC
jgi:hypothetical protein